MSVRRRWHVPTVAEYKTIGEIIFLLTSSFGLGEKKRKATCWMVALQFLMRCFNRGIFQLNDQIPRSIHASIFVLYLRQSMRHQYH